jgi:hypothetical protein
MEIEFKDLTKDIDFTNKELVQPLDIDVVMTGNSWVEFTVKDSEIPIYENKKEDMVFLDYDIPMRAYKIKGYFHTIKYNNGVNYGVDYYICPRDVEPNFDNLQPFDKDDWSVWGITTKSSVHRRKESIQSNYRTIITRNGKEFDSIPGREMGYALIEAQAYIHKLEEPNVPINFLEIDFEKKIIGYKCEWKGRPCTITRYIMGQNCVILDILGEVGDYDEGETIKDHIFSSSFNWFPKDKG